MSKIFMMCLLLTTTAWGGEKWFKCQRKSDCVKVTGHCGRARSVNKKYKKDYLLQVKKDQPTILCMKPLEKELKADLKKEVSCKSQVCGFKN